MNNAATLRTRRCAMALAVMLATASDSHAGPAVSSASRTDIKRGQRLLAQYQCGSCHAIPGVPISRGVAGPDLSGFGKRSYIAGHIPNRADLLAQWIADPRSLVPTTSMPDMGVSPDDAHAMAAYLHSLR